MDQAPGIVASTTGGEVTESKKSGKVIKVIIASVVVLVLLVSFGIYGLYSAASAPGKAAKSFLKSAASGDITTTYNMTSSEFKEVTTEEDLSLFFEYFPIVVEATNVSFDQFSIEDGIATVSGTIESADASSPITFTLIKEEDKWKVVNFSLEEEDVPGYGEVDDEE